MGITVGLVADDMLGIKKKNKLNRTSKYSWLEKVNANGAVGVRKHAGSRCRCVYKRQTIC